MSADMESWEVLSSLLAPESVRAAVSASSFMKMLGPPYWKAMRENEDTDPDDLFDALCDINPKIKQKTEPFIIIQATLANLKKGTPQWFLITEKILYSLDNQSGEQTIYPSPIKEVVKKSDFLLKLRHEDLTKTILKLESPIDNLFNLLTRYIESTQSENAFFVLLESLALLKETPPPFFPKLYSLIMSLFTQPDYFPLRCLINTRLDSQTKRCLGTALIKFHASDKSLCFYMSYITACYFLNPPAASELLRGDSILTNSLAGVRDVFCPNFFRVLAEYLDREICGVDDPDEIITKFLEIVRTQTTPGVLRWLCWLLFTEARISFPDGNAPYHAVSGFFFLRGLWPNVARLTNQDSKKKLMALSGLTNFCPKPEFEKHIPRLREVLHSISLEVDDPDIVSAPRTDEVKAAVASLLATLHDHADNIRLQLAGTVPAGLHPLRWFVGRQIQESKKHNF